jgi:tetratricopeptide (TPR) repeat protein
MRALTIISILFLFPAILHAQAASPELQAGNKAYRQQQYANAAESYRKALAQVPGSPIAGFNLGNALYKDKRNGEAQQAYDQAIQGAHGTRLLADTWYNKGVVLGADQKLEESVNAYKNALRLNAADTMARENLQRAMNELRRRREQEQQKQKKQNDQQKMSKQQVQQLLQALQDQERMLQQKVAKSRVPSPSQPEKDW